MGMHPQYRVPEPVTTLAGLTPRQREIAALVAEGLTNREIGERLGVAEQSVKNQLTHIVERCNLPMRLNQRVLIARMVWDEQHEEGAA